MINYLLSLLLLAATVREMTLTGLPYCLVSQNFIILIHFGSHLGLILTSMITGRNWSKPHEILEHVSNISLLIVLVSFPINYYKTPECMSEDFMWLMFWYFIPLLFLCILVMILVTIYLIYVSAVTMYQQYMATNTRKEIIKLLRVCLTDPTALRDYYKHHEDSLKTIPIMEEEMIVFKDNFEKDHKEIEDKYDTADCVICYGDFDACPRAVTYPGCYHIYHYDCLKTWFDSKKTTCPYCKKEFRIAFGEELCEKASVGVLRLSSVHEKMLIDAEKKPSSTGMYGQPEELMPDIGGIGVGDVDRRVPNNRPRQIPNHVLAGF